MHAGLLGHLDVIQIPAPMALQERELVAQLAAMGKAVVVNSPIRKITPGVTPRDAYHAVLAVDGVAMVLCGTRSV